MKVLLRLLYLERRLSAQEKLSGIRSGDRVCVSICGNRTSATDTPVILSKACDCRGIFVHSQTNSLYPSETPPDDSALFYNPHSIAEG